MSSKREEERNEKIIRGLMKLPPNRKCINCNSLGPQYVCTNFWTFVCMSCSGVHREFTHRVKSVSMAKFTKQEVEALQQGGNQRARETYLKDWDMQGMRLPDSSNPDKIRQFIRDVYVNKKYSGVKSSEKPPRDMEGLKNHEDQRRASSYHSFSQSPPYDHQYEDRRYGKQSGMLSRRPGSDRGLYEGKTANFLYSPGGLQAQMYEDRFANESSGSRMSDFSVSSAGDAYKYDLQSPSSQGTGYSSPSYQPRDIVVEDGRPQIANRFNEANVRNLDGIPRPKRTASTGSFTSSEGNPVSHRSVDPADPVYAILEPGHSKRGQAVPSVIPALSKQSQDHFSLALTSSPSTSFPSVDLFANFNEQPSSTNVFEQKLSASVHPVKQDLFNLPPVQPQNTAPLDLFADFGNQPSSTSFLEQKSLAVPAQQTQSKFTASPPLDLFANFDNKPSSTSFLKQKLSAVPAQQTQLQNVASAHVNIFPDFGNQPSSSSFQKPLAVPAQQNEGWATFELPQYSGGQSTTNAGKSAGLPPANEALGGSVVGLASHRSNSEWVPVHNSVAPGNMLQQSSQWHKGQNEYKISEVKNSSELWNAFDGSNAKVSTKSDMNPTKNMTTEVPALHPDTPAFSFPVAAVSASPVPPFPPIVNGPTQVAKSINPFDLSYEELESNKMLLDMSSLEAALPNSQMTDDFFVGLPQPWNSQNPAGLIISSLPEGGGLQFMAGQPPNSQFPSIPPQGPVAPLGGNPFA